MEASRWQGNVRLLRPLLGFSRHRLIATVNAEGQDYVEDPSNQNPRYERVRMRRLMRDLNLSAQSLADMARVMGEVRRSMSALVDWAESLLVSHHPMGFAVVDRFGLADLPKEVGLRLLSRLVRRVGGGHYPPRSERLERLLNSQCGTLSGCRAVPKSESILLLCREARGIEGPKDLPPGQSVIWDRRFRVSSVPNSPLNAQVGALGDEGWKSVKSRKSLKVPAVIRTSLPAIWVDGLLHAVPHLGYIAPHDACIISDCHYFSIEALGYNCVPSPRG